MSQVKPKINLILSSGKQVNLNFFFSSISCNFLYNLLILIAKNVCEIIIRKTIWVSETS
jgi:hypothetical protein